MALKICGLIVCAGMSSRMDRFKPLLDIGGEPMILKTAKSLIAGGAERLVVVVGNRADDVRSALSPIRENVIFAENKAFASTDMMTSVKIGAAELPDCDAFFLMPGDMPFVGKETFLSLRDAFSPDCDAVFPVVDGRRGHPVLISSRVIGELVSFSKDGGLKAFLREREIKREVKVSDKGIFYDLDTPEDCHRHNINLH